MDYGKGYRAELINRLKDENEEKIPKGILTQILFALVVVVMLGLVGWVLGFIQFLL